MIDSSLNPDMVRERLRDLYARHYGFVRQACWRYVQNDEDADDLAHEVLIKAARASESFQGACSTTTWLYRVAVNHCRDSIRGGRRRQEAHARYLREPLWQTWLSRSTKQSLLMRGEAGPCEPSDERTVKAARVLEELRFACDGPERHIIYLCFDVGMPQQGIARVVGLPRAAIVRRMARIRDLACSLYFNDRARTERPRDGRITGILGIRG